MNTAYDEILDFITSGPSLEEIAAFELSEQTASRVHNLLEKQSNGQITPAEEDELEEFARAEHLIEKLKIRAQRRLE